MLFLAKKKDTDDNNNEGNISKNKLIGEWEIESDLFEVYKNGKLIESYMEEGGELEIFNSNGIYIYDNGDTGKWTLSSNKLTIKYLVEEDDTEVWTITKLTSSEMVRELQESEDGYVYKYKVTSRKL